MSKEKFVPYEKMSKKDKRELNAIKRGDWGKLNPVTRVEKSKKTYDRHSFHDSLDEFDDYTY